MTVTVPQTIAIVGSGPAGLMAATQLANSHPDLKIHLFEKRPALGRKLLIAGSSGLNISHELSPSEFAAHYEGWDKEFWLSLFQNYSTGAWIDFIEQELKLETFLGTSDRYFVREMKASGLLKRWTDYLKERKVTLHPQCELSDFQISGEQKIDLQFTGPHPSEFTRFTADYVILALGGASWEPTEPAWAELLREKQISVIPFTASNVGYEVNWDKKFLKEAEGKPLKKVELQTSRGKKIGELVVTEYGLEGTPIYFCGTPGKAFLDLKPDLTEDEIFTKLSKVKENLSPMRRVKHHLSLCEASESLVFHTTTDADKSDLKRLIAKIKNLPIELKNARPLSESISSRGGVDLGAIDDHFALKKYPNLYCAGEMLAWDAPTGGFLIQASISQGAQVAKNVLLRVKST